MNLTKIASLDWSRIENELTDSGYAKTGPLLTTEQCRELASGYEDSTQFRSRIVMSRHGFGRGEYQYYSYPLPPLIQSLRETLYPPLASIANKWNETLGIPSPSPPNTQAFKSSATKPARPDPHHCS
jgi:uncharacterized protein